MKNFYKIVFFKVFILIHGILYAQSDLDAFIQNNFPVPQSDLNYEDIYENLYQYYTNPLDLNTASADELKGFYILTDKQINAFVEHLKKYGKLLSIYELQSIAHFDKTTIQKIAPFLTIQEKKSPKSLLKRLQEEENTYFLWRISSTLETKKGYNLPDSIAYQGNRLQNYMRFRSSHSKDFSIGFTMEKDSGEKKWNDFFSFHAVLYNKNKFNTIAIGDFRLQTGQGLVLAAGLNIGKGAEPILTTRRSTLGILPYTSVLESGFFRGLAIDYQIVRNTKLIFFHSINYKDASLNDTSVQSLAETGYHRTANELSKKNQVLENTTGLVLRYQKQNTELGINYLATFFNKNLQENDRIYNRFDFSGKNNQNLSFFYNTTIQNFNFFGEIALSSSGGKAFLGGFLANLSDKVQTSVLFRKYDKNYQAFYGSAFGENTQNQNEQGNYWGLKIAFNNYWSLNAYVDVFRFDWLKYLTNSPSTGYNYLARLSYTPSRNAGFYAQFSEEQKDRNADAVPQKAVLPALKRNFQFNAEVSVQPALKMRTRLQMSSLYFNNRLTTGFLALQDISYQHKNIQFTQRFALFDTDDYDNRQYVYEQDVLYTFSFPAYYDVGLRNYWILNYSLGKKIDFWIKYAITSYKNKTKISSGLEQIDGNSQQTIRFQVRYKF